MAKKLLQKETKIQKTYTYTQGGTSLSFTLNIENSSEARSFIACLKEAQRDLENDIADMKN